MSQNDCRRHRRRHRRPLQAALCRRHVAAQPGRPIVALADKLETLVGMFGIGQIPTGDRDPFALRRHALGVIRMLIEGNLNLPLNELLTAAASVFAAVDGFKPAESALADFIFDRLAGSLREQGYTAQEVDAVVSQRPQRLGDIPKRLAAVRAFSALPEAAALAAANKRVGNILKKVEDSVDAWVDTALLRGQNCFWEAGEQRCKEKHSDDGDHPGHRMTTTDLTSPGAGVPWMDHVGLQVMRERAEDAGRQPQPA